MKYSVHCGTPPACGRGREERLAFMEFDCFARRGVFSICSCGPWEGNRGKHGSIEDLRSVPLVRHRDCGHFMRPLYVTA